MIEFKSKYVKVCHGFRTLITALIEFELQAPLKYIIFLATTISIQEICENIAQVSIICNKSQCHRIQKLICESV